MADILVIATDNHIYVDCLNITTEIRAFMDGLEACNMVDPTWQPGCYTVHPNITKHIRFEDGKVILNKRWCKDICSGGGIPLHPFVAWQLEGFNLLEQINQGMLDIRFYLGSDEYVVDFPDVLPERMARGEEDTKRLVKIMKKTYSKDSGNQGCPVHGKNLKTGNSWMCCMCNKTEKVIAIAK